MGTKESTPFADYPSSWSGKVEADFTLLKKMLFPPLEHTFAVFDSDAVDKDGNPIAMLHCHRCGKGGWADIDSVTRYCPDCGRVVANCREWQEVVE